MIRVKNDLANFTAYENPSGKYTVVYNDVFGGIAKFTATEDELLNIIEENKLTKQNHE